MLDNGGRRKNAEVTMRLRVGFTTVKVLEAIARYESLPAILIYEIDACGSSTISCSTSQTHCSLTVTEGICQLDFSYHFYGGGKQMALSVYKLNDVLLSESGLPVTSSECLSFSKEYSSEDSFETITSFVYCYQTTAICKPSEAVSRSTPSISVFTSAVDASSSTDSTTSAFNFSSCDTLQHLANISLNAANVGEVLRLVLKLIQTSSLTPEDIYYISLIVRNASRVPNLLLEVRFSSVHSRFPLRTLSQFQKLWIQFLLSRYVSFISAIMAISIPQTGNLLRTCYFTLQFLRSIPDLFRNSPPRAEYMNGSLIALLGRNVDCSPDIDEGEQLEGIADSGGSFELVTADDHPDIDDGASISVPRDVICRSQALKYYFVVFRNSNFFVGNETNYRSRDDELDELTDGCTVGKFLADRRILSATLLKPNSTVSHFSVEGVEQTMAILRYGKRKVAVVS
uniref:Folliculin n=1 Tax=Ascaris lumbricoides TaxID=6252 RepID=A0A0M3I720_ASCLU